MLHFYAPGSGMIFYSLLLILFYVLKCINFIQLPEVHQKWQKWHDFVVAYGKGGKYPFGGVYNIYTPPNMVAVFPPFPNRLEFLKEVSFLKTCICGRDLSTTPDLFDGPDHVICFDCLALPDQCACKPMGHTTIAKKRSGTHLNYTYRAKT